MSKYTKNKGVLHFGILSPPPGAVARPNRQFTNSTIPLLINDLDCYGNESSILDCSFNQRQVTSCGVFEEAGVVCQGE